MRGLTKGGLRRRGVSEESLAALARAYRAIFASGKPQREAAREVDAAGDALVERLVRGVLAG